MANSTMLSVAVLNLDDVDTLSGTICAFSSEKDGYRRSSNVIYESFSKMEAQLLLVYILINIKYMFLHHQLQHETPILLFKSETGKE